MSWLTTGRIFSILILIILTSQIFTTIVSEPEEEYDPEIEKRGMEGEMRIASDPGPGVEQSRGSRTEQDIKLNEIMLFPNTGGPWVEIHNRGVEHMPIDHWLISDEDGLTYEIEMRTAVPPGNYVVVHFESGVSETEFGQSQPNAIHLYTGWKNVKWTPHEVDPFTNYIRAAVGYDILPGGKPEIIANYFGGTRISIYEPIGGDIAQGWQKTDIITAPPVDYGSYRVVPIDVDMDSFTDLVFNNYFGNENGDDSIYWLKAPITNPKDPWNGPYPIDKVRRPEGLCAGNISGDDLTDIVVGGEFDNDIYWYQCPPDPMVDIWTRYNIDTNFNKPGGLWLTDMDIDGDKDLVAVGSYGEEVTWYQRPPDPTTGTWTKHNIYKSTRSRGPAVELEGTEQTRSGSRR